MINKKSIDDKQLIRTISDIVVKNPSFADEIFRDNKDIISIFPELEEISNFISTNHNDGDIFYKKLSIAINEIKDKETKAIFTSSLNLFLSEGN